MTAASTPSRPNPAGATKSSSEEWHPCLSLPHRQQLGSSVVNVWLSYVEIQESSLNLSKDARLQLLGSCKDRGACHHRPFGRRFGRSRQPARIGRLIPMFPEGWHVVRLLGSWRLAEPKMLQRAAGTGTLLGIEGQQAVQEV